MLVLSRKPGQKILIGERITITVVRIGPSTVRIGIEAPPDINIRRQEIEIQVPEEMSDDEIVEQVSTSIEISHLESESTDVSHSRDGS